MRLDKPLDSSTAPLDLFPIATGVPTEDPTLCLHPYTTILSPAELFASGTPFISSKLTEMQLSEKQQAEWGTTSNVTIYEDLTLTTRHTIDLIQAEDDANGRLERLEEEDAKANGTHSPSTGGVYFSWSSCMNCMKIGATRKNDPTSRLRIASSYTITPFTLIAWMPTKFPFKLEAAAHRNFDEKRINRRNGGSGAGTEFFRISESDVSEWFTRLPEFPEKKAKKQKASTGNVFDGMSEIEIAEMKEKRKSAFSLKGLMKQMDIKIDRAYMPSLGKCVSLRFSMLRPGGEKFTKKKTTYFYDIDRECIENLIRDEFSKHQLRKEKVDLHRHDQGESDMCISSDTEMEPCSNILVLAGVNASPIETAINDGLAKKKQSDRDAAVSIQIIMDQMGFEVNPEEMPGFCSDVTAKFLMLCPGSEIFTKKKTTYFFEKDRESLERIIQGEFMNKLRSGLDFFPETTDNPASDCDFDFMTTQADAEAKMRVDTMCFS